MTAAVPAGDPGAHTWPCPLFYVNEDRTATCTCASTAPGIPDAPTPDPGALLDRLEEARKAATIPGPDSEQPVTEGERSSLALDALWTDDPYPEYSQDEVLRAYRLGAEDQRGQDANLSFALPALIRLARDGLALRAGIERLAEEADARVRASVPASAAERLIADGAHTVKVGDLRAVVADTSGEAKQ